MAVSFIRVTLSHVLSSITVFGWSYFEMTVGQTASRENNTVIKTFVYSCELFRLTELCRYNGITGLKISLFLVNSDTVAETLVAVPI
jgi:hypothetical protein